MTLQEKANSLALKLIEVDKLLNSYELDKLSEEELDELEKIRKIYEFYAFSVLELSFNENKKFFVANPKLTTDVIEEIEYFLNAILK